MDKKFVSVIIPNFNYSRYLFETINSVLNQSHAEIECIVVNNGSTDDSLKVLSQFGSKIRILDQENRGQSGARNAGLNVAEGDFIAFLDADDYWCEQKIESQLKLLNDETELVYCGISKFEDISRKEIERINPKFKGDCSDAFLEYPGVSIVLSGESTAIFSRNLLRKVGEFDSELNSAAGWDFFRRASKFTNFDYVDSPLTKYRVHGQNMSKSIESNVSDIRLAYRKLFMDLNWVVSDSDIERTMRTLEYTFLKTFIRNKNVPLAIKSIRTLCSKRIQQFWF
jgi:glycosyltransferase involved in cell wall biosynthesis